MKKYLISGIAPGSSGVGRLMKVLVPQYQSRGYVVITPRLPNEARLLLRQRNYSQLVIELFYKYFGKLVFSLRCLSAFGSEVVFLHPQTAGYCLLIGLSLVSRVSLYVMDCSFFCICSYNNHPITRTECLDCLGALNPHRQCQPWPGKLPKRLNLLYLRLLQLVASRISFMAQNNLQAELLQAHFGQKIEVSIVGMPAEDQVAREDNLSVALSQCSEVSYDVVLHAASHAAKGLFYLIDLAKLMPKYSFLVPDSSSNIISLLGFDPPPNVSCIPMTWETGLEHAVIHARLVLNPSLWSAPIEGALLKSARSNHNVATVVSRYGYESEISLISNHIRLPRDPRSASQVLQAFFAS